MQRELTFTVPTVHVLVKIKEPWSFSDFYNFINESYWYLLNVNVAKVCNDLKWWMRILCPIRFLILENYQDTAESRFWVARLLIV
jgi:hypothetical protein